MPLYKLTDQQLNYFKYAAVVLDEFPAALRKTFKSMWDNRYAGPPASLPWDDSAAVRNQLKAQEGGTKCKIPTPLSYDEWDCTALFQATIYAESFKERDAFGNLTTLGDKYVKPFRLSSGVFHATVTSRTGNHSDTITLAIDQLRRLRNTACHQSSTHNIDKATFDRYMKLAGDSFSALGLSTATIDNIKGLKEEDFPTEKVQGLLERLLAEANSMLKLQQGLEDITGEVKNLKEIVESLQDQLRSFIKEHTTSLKLESRIFPMVPHFLGRDRECDEIVDHLTNQPTRLVSVWGSPGFGKTSAATAVGHKLDSLGYTVLFTSLRQVTSVSDMAQRILALSPHRDHAGTAVKDEVLKWLSSVSDPLYLFFDNADGMLGNRDEYFQFLRDILASCKTVKLLCTTRESLECLSHWFSTAPFRIQPLDEPSSRELVQTLAPDVNDSECDTIAKVCGNVPLAIKLACSIFVENGKLSSYWEEFSEELKSDTIQALDMPDNPAELRLKPLFEQCFRSLRIHQQESFVCLSVFDGSFDVSAAVAVLDLKRLAAKKRLDELVKRSLLEYNADGQLYTIHPLLQSFGELLGTGEMETVFENAKVRFYGYYLSVLEKLNAQFLGGESSVACRSFQREQQNIIQSLLNGTESHYLTVVRALSQSEILLASIFWNDKPQFEDIYDNAIGSAQMSNQASDHSQLLISKAFAFLTLGDDRSTELLREAEELHDSNSAETKGKLRCYQGIDQLIRGAAEDGMQCIQAANSILNGNSTRSGTTVLVEGILGILNEDVTKEDMLEWTQLVPPVSSFNSECPGTAAKADQPFMLQMVHVLCTLCKRSNTSKIKAQSMIRFVLEVQKQLEESLKSDEIHLNSLYNAVGSLLLELEQYDQACRCYTRILESQYRADPTGDTVEKADSHHLLGYILFQLKNYQGSLESCTKAAVMQEKLLGDHENTASSYNNLGGAQYELADYQGALESFTKALDMRKKLLGEHVDTSHSYHELGCTQFRLADYQRALGSHSKALAMRKKLLGEHTDTAHSYHELGCTQFKLADYQGALESHSKAAGMREKLVGEHVDTADSYYELGCTRYELADYQRAQESFTKALALRKKLLGEHVNTAHSYHELGCTQYQLADYQGAMESHTKAAGMRENLLEEHVNTADSYHELGCTQFQVADCQGALQSLTRAANMRHKLLGKHRDAANSYHDLGCIQFQLTDYQGALESLTKSAEMRHELLGLKHISTAASYYSLGRAQYELFDDEAALKSFAEAATMRYELLGKHQDTAKAFTWLMHAQFRQYDFVGARESATIAVAMNEKLLGENVETATSYNSLGTVQVLLGDFESALDSFEKAAAMRYKLLGDNENTAHSFFNIGITLIVLGEYEHFQQPLVRALGMRQTLFGEDADTAFDRLLSAWESTD